MAPHSPAAIEHRLTVADDLGVQKVRLWVDDTYFGYDGSAQYAMSWNTTTVTNGPHTLRLQAVDNAGNVSGDATVSATVSS